MHRLAIYPPARTDCLTLPRTALSTVSQPRTADADGMTVSWWPRGYNFVEPFIQTWLFPVFSSDSPVTGIRTVSQPRLVTHLDLPTPTNIKERASFCQGVHRPTYIATLAPNHLPKPCPPGPPARPTVAAPRSPRAPKYVYFPLCPLPSPSPLDAEPLYVVSETDTSAREQKSSRSAS